MNKKVFFGQNDLRFLYYRYKDSKYYSLSVFALTILVCIVLLVGVVIPQFGTYVSISQEVSAQRAKIKSINENINFVNGMDKPLLNKQLQTATSALPSDKDFMGILNTLADSSIRSGVTVSDFSFNVGEVSSKSAAGKAPSNSSAPGGIGVENVSSPQKIDAPSIGVTILVNGSIDRVKNFIREVAASLPLVEISSLDFKPNSSSIVLKFYYKPLPEISFQEDTPIAPLTEEKIKLIEKLASWQRSTVEEITAPVGTGSAAPLFE